MDCRNALVPYNRSAHTYETYDSTDKKQSVVDRLFEVAKEKDEENLLQFLHDNHSQMDDLDFVDEKENSVLHHICFKGMAQAIFELVDRNLPVDLLNHRNTVGKTALHYLAAHELPNIAKKLIKAGAKVDIHDLEGNTPLHIAAESGKLGMVSCLLKKKGEIIDWVNHKHDTALSLAIAKGHASVVEALLEKGASALIKNGSGLMAYHQAFFGKQIPLELIQKIWDQGSGKTNDKIKTIARKLLDDLF